MSESNIVTLGQLLDDAEERGVKPATFGSHQYMTMVIRDGQLWLERTSPEEFEKAKYARLKQLKDKQDAGKSKRKAR